MASEHVGVKKRIRKIVFTISKATVKTAVILIVYVIVSQLLAPVSPLVPGLQEMLRTFVIVYISLMIVSDLTSGTILHYIFGAARCGFVMAYLIVSLNSGIFDYTFGNLSLIVDVRLFLVIVMLLEVLGMAKSVIQALDFVGQKTELMQIG